MARHQISRLRYCVSRVSWQWMVEHIKSLSLNPHLAKRCVTVVLDISIKYLCLQFGSSLYISYFVLIRANQSRSDTWHSSSFFVFLVRFYSLASLSGFNFTAVRSGYDGSTRRVLSLFKGKILWAVLSEVGAAVECIENCFNRIQLEMLRHRICGVQ